MAQLRVHSGLPYLHVPRLCIELIEVVGRVMASLDTAPVATSADFVLLTITCTSLAVESNRHSAPRSYGSRVTPLAACPACAAAAGGAFADADCRMCCHLLHSAWQ